jgi:hypothetical protein
MDAAVRAKAAPLPDSLDSRLSRLEAKHSACQKSVRERVARLEARVDTVETRLGVCEEMAEQARVRSLTTSSTLTVVQN